jgi:hypothetical protein
MPELRPITDVKYYNGEVFVTGISNHRFASTLYRIPYPFTGKKATTTVEIWHPVHGDARMLLLGRTDLQPGH